VCVCMCGCMCVRASSQPAPEVKCRALQEIVFLVLHISKVDDRSLHAQDEKNKRAEVLGLRIDLSVRSACM